MRLIITLLLLMMPYEAFACSCGQSTFDGAFKGATLVLSVSVADKVGAEQSKLHVDELWKGKAPTEFVAKLVTGLSASCGATATIQPDKGTKYLLYLGELPTDGTAIIHFNGCSRNQPGRYEAGDLELLQAYRSKLEGYDAAIKAKKGDKYTYYQKALFLRENGDWQNAEELLQKLTRENPKYSEAWAQLASLTLEKSEAINAYGRDTEKGGRDKQALYEKALQYAETALKLSPSDKLARNVRLVAQIQLGQVDAGNYENADLSERHFRGQIFEGKRFKGSSFKDSDLNGVMLKGSQFKDVSFENTDFAGTKFVNSSVAKANFDNAEFFGASYSDGKGIVRLAGGAFEESRIDGSSFKKTRIKAPIINTSILHSNFEEASFEGGFEDNEQTLISGVKAEDTSFRHISVSSQMGKLAEIKDSTFLRCDFSNAKISSKLTNLDFSRSILTDLDLSGSTYDCKTKWPAGFDPVAHGAVDAESCNKLTKAPDFTGKQFDKYMNFGPINLNGAKFTYAKLEGARFYQTNLKSADFSGAFIQNADFREANLEGAKLRNLSLYGVSFEGANLKNADFAGADFSNARFGADSNLNEANLTLARLSPQNFKNLPKSFSMDQHAFVYGSNQCDAKPEKTVKMHGADLTGINLAYSCMQNADLSKAKLDKGTLYNAILFGADLKDASFIGAKYSCDTALDKEDQHILSSMILVNHSECTQRPTPASQLAGANLRHMNLRYAMLKNANLENADLSGANLSQANLTGANVKGAKFKNAFYTSGTQWPEGFDPEKLGAVKIEAESVTSME